MKTYLVGGAVRDLLLKIPIKEKDWVVIGATIKDMLSAGYQQVGKSFPVFLHPKNKEEYSLARTEKKCGQGYTGFTCYTSPKITLEEDLSRRDLTINAIALDTKGNIIDPYQGQKDLKQRVLRHVSNSFVEDPLRVLRIARFAARFTYLNFRIATRTMILMKSMINELKLLSPERIWKETEKALQTQNPNIYFQILHECGALKLIFPELNMLFGIKLKDKWHKNIDIGMHTLMSVFISSRLSKNIEVRFATLCHDLGKHIINKNNYSNCKKFNCTGIKLVKILCYRLKVPNTLRNLAIITIKYNHLLHFIEYLTPKVIIKLFYAIDVWRKPERLEYMIISGKADALSRPGFEKYSYPQENFLRQAYIIANSVNINSLIKLGFSGINLGRELYLKRESALINWKNIK